MTKLDKGGLIILIYLIVLIKKILDMGNSRNRERKTRRNMPIEKENEARKKKIKKELRKEAVQEETMKTTKEEDVR